ncbi:MAG: GNAT family N-acetyltransferase [Acidobacteriota bacterium]
MTLLENPIWNALRTRHADNSLGGDLARRYPAEIGPLAGIAEESPACYEALRGLLAGPTDVLVLFLPQEPEPIPGWNLLRSGAIYQMVRKRRVPETLGHQTSEITNVGVPQVPDVGTSDITRSSGAPGPSLLGTWDSTTLNTTKLDLRKLGAIHAPAMVALAELTEPGPFRLRTLELGTFYGVFEDDRLVSMAGKRMHLPGYVEVSGVCTHPDARGRGYARLLMSLVIDEIERDGDNAFLHVLTENPAIRIYENLGFSIERTFHFAALGTEAAAQAAAPHPPNPNRCG